MDLQFKNFHVVVVGGSYGIGLTIVKEFLAENAFVHVISRNKNDKTVKELEEKYSSSVFFYSCDATVVESLSKTVEKILINSGNRIDVVVSNVGNGKGQQIPISEVENWETSWNINFNSALNCARIFSQALIESNGSLIFVSSIAGIEFIGAPTDYSTAKSAIITFAKSLSHRLAPNVRVNVVAPGNIWTEEGTWKNKMEKDPIGVNNVLQTKVPLQRFGTTAEVSNAVLFLSSTKASFITGACLVVDGGQTISF